MSLNREQLMQKRGADFGTLCEVEIPEFGDSVCLRPPTVGDRDKLSAWAVKPENAKNTEIRKRLVAICLCDSEGKRLIADNQIADLDGFSDAVIDRLFDKAQEVCGLAESAKDKEKNSETTPSEDSASS